jgi:hypothetical protein
MRSIWLSQNISRVEIAKALKLDKSTITIIVNDLIAAGLVREVAVGEASPRGGRKPVYLTVNKDFGCVVGIEVQPQSYSIVALNLQGDILYSENGPARARGDNLVELVLGLVDRAIGHLGPSVRVIGVGVGVPGIVNQRDGKIIVSMPLGAFEELDFRAAIAEKLRLPVFLENDANCCAWSEIAFHRSFELRNFLFALIEFRRGSVDVDLFTGIAIGLGLVIRAGLLCGRVPKRFLEGAETVSARAIRPGDARGEDRSGDASKVHSGGRGQHCTIRELAESQPRFHRR